MPTSTSAITTIPSPIGSTRYQDTGSDQNVVAVKGSAGKVHQVFADNILGSAVVYIELFDIAAASVNLASDVPIMVLPIPAGKALTFGFRDLTNNDGAVFGTAIAVCAVTASCGASGPSYKPRVEIVFT
jgi:hypothetical protein